MWHYSLKIKYAEYFWFIRRCGLYAVPEDSGCYIKEIDYSLPHPECCPKMICDDNVEPETMPEPVTVTEPETSKAPSKKCRKSKCDCDCDCRCNSKSGFLSKIYKNIFNNYFWWHSNFF